MQNTQTKFAKFTQDFIPIKDIRLGMIITEDNEYIKILEIEPINFTLRSAEEKESIIESYAGWLKVSPVFMHFKEVSKTADVSDYINHVERVVSKEPNQKCTEFSQHYINLVHRIGSQNAVSRRFFIILGYEPKNELEKKTDPAQIALELNNVASKTRSFFATFGNEIVSHENEDYFLAETLYAFYNRRSSITETFEDRMSRIASDARKIHNLSEEAALPHIPLKYVLAPKGIDFTHSDYIIMDGLYYTFLYVTSKGFPVKVAAGWLTDLVTLGEGIDIDFFMKKDSRSTVINNVGRRIRLDRINLKEKSDTNSDYEDIENSLASGMYIKNTLKNTAEDPYNINLFITVTGKTYEQLMWRKEQILDFMTAKEIEVRECPFRQEQALKTVSPFLYIDPNLYRKSRRNSLTGGVASCYPFTAYEMFDNEGIMMGVNMFNSSVCVIDQFNTKRYKNANMFIAGTSGAGKTFTMQLLALRQRMMGTQCFIISPAKAHEFKRACNAIGGSFIEISPSSRDCINVMEIRPTADPVKELLDGYEYQSESWLSKKVQDLITFFELLMEDLTNEEEQLLDSAIVETYRRKGITSDNDSLFIDPKDKTKGLKEMPILGDLDKVLAEQGAKIPPRIRNVLSKFITGSAQVFNGQTNVDLDNKYIVIDLEKIKGRFMPAGMFIALNLVYEKAKEDRTKKKSIFIDEGWALIGAGSNHKAAEYVQELFKVIRGYGGAAILATQDISDVFSSEENSKYASAIISCSKIKVVLNLEDEEAKKVKDVLQLTSAEVKNIVRYAPGQALICANNNHVPVTIKASELEEELITTDRAKLEMLLARKRSGTA